jgi:hypothetical protein
LITLPDITARLELQRQHKKRGRVFFVLIFDKRAAYGRCLTVMVR